MYDFIELFYVTRGAHLGGAIMGTLIGCALLSNELENKRHAVSGASTLSFYYASLVPIYFSFHFFICIFPFLLFSTFLILSSFFLLHSLSSTSVCLLPLLPIVGTSALMSISIISVLFSFVFFILIILRFSPHLSTVGSPVDIVSMCCRSFHRLHVLCGSLTPPHNRKKCILS